MADLNRLTKLFQAIAASDWNLADAIAREVANSEEQIGHHAAAQRLRGALHRNGHPPSTGIGTPEPSNGNGATYFLSSALTAVAADTDLADLRLKSVARIQLEEIATEWVKREKLSAHHIERRTKLLFHGPPGCGKSATARAMGRELGLAVYVVRFDAIVGSFLGQTALHLRQLFRFAEMTPCVILIDEIDALGKRRGSPQDVGELDRVVIALLQELEHSRPAGLLIATSNLARQLDDALWRRFDMTLEFPRPSQTELRSFAGQRMKFRGLTPTSRIQKELTRAKNYADVDRFVSDEKRRKVLRED